VVKGGPAEWGTCSRTISLNSRPLSLAYKKGVFATGLESGQIAVFDIITGSQMALLHRHTKAVNSITFSLDGIFLVSGSADMTVKLWDVQTGGVVKTFSGDISLVCCVAISSDNTTIASEFGQAIHLWHVQTGDCFCIIDGLGGLMRSISFSPTNPQLLISANYDGNVQQWGIDGCQIGPSHRGWGVAFSLDGINFVSWVGHVATVQNSDSRVVVAKLQVSSGNFVCCCFSFDGKFVAGSVDHTCYIWDITGLDPHLIKTLIGHTNEITSLIFPSSLITASTDNTIKFWQTSAPSTDPGATDRGFTPLTPSKIRSVSLQVRDGVAISSDSFGVVKTWDILTGLCKASSYIPAPRQGWRDVQPMGGRLIVVWHEDQKLYIRDAEEGKFLQVVDTTISEARGVRISGDGSKVFCLANKSIQAWSIWTGEPMGEVELEDEAYFDPLYMGGSKVLVCFKDSQTQGWDFGTSGSSPIQLSNTSLDRPRLDLIGGTKWDTCPSMIKDMVTGKGVFQLVGKYAYPSRAQWDGQYLVAGYESGELLILDFTPALC